MGLKMGRFSERLLKSSSTLCAVGQLTALRLPRRVWAGVPHGKQKWKFTILRPTPTPTFFPCLGSRTLAARLTPPKRLEQTSLGKPDQSKRKDQKILTVGISQGNRPNRPPYSKPQSTIPFPNKYNTFKQPFRAVLK